MDWSSFDKLVLLIDSLGPEDPLESKSRQSNSQGSYDGLGGSSSSSSKPKATITEIKEAGAQLQAIIEDAGRECKVRECNLRLDELEASEDWTVGKRPNQGLPNGIKPADMTRLGLPTHGYRIITVDGVNPNTGTTDNTWKGRAIKGVLFIEDIARFGTVFVTCVVNKETRPYAESVWKGPELKEFESGSRAYQILLGTRIGKTVAYLLLAAFGQGVRGIARIAVWWTGQHDHILQLRFDFEDI